MGIGLYIHIPFCEKKCKYCDFYSVIGDTSQKRAYIDRVIEEGKIRLKRAEIDTVYAGGGTPTCLDGGEMTRLINGLGIDTERLKEFTIEGNPNSFNNYKIDEYKALGATRVSVGVQSLSDESLKAIGRLHNAEAAISCVKALVKSGLRVSVDYMLGLPYQSLDAVKREINEIIGLGAEHVSCYALILEPGTELERAVRKKEITVADDDAAADMYDAAAELLERNGLARYETSNFGKPCIHNIGYWRLKEYIGLGAAAHGMVTPERYALWADNNNENENSPDFQSVSEAQPKFIRYSNPSSINAYLLGACGETEIINLDESASEYVMLGLRLKDGVDLTEYAELYGGDKTISLIDKAKRLEKYLNIDCKRISIKDEFIYAANAVISELI